MRVLAALLLYLALPAAAADFRPFAAASRAAIERAHAGTPFVLAFWSVDCVYCAGEIAHLRDMARAHPQVRVVLVSTDPPEAAAAAAAMLDKLLEGTAAERWMFAGDAERLVFAVDRKWHGELPRSYFYDAAGTARAVSGRVEPAWLENWVAATGRR